MIAVYNTPDTPTTVLNDSSLSLEGFREIIDTIPTGVTRVYFVLSAVAEAIGLPKKTFFMIACYGTASTKIVLGYPLDTTTDIYKMYRTSSGWRDWTPSQGEG